MHPSPLPPAALELDAAHLMRWARGIARGVCRDAAKRGGGDPRFHRRSAAEEDLEGVAIVALVELMHRIDELRLTSGTLTEMFIGAFEVEIRSRCRRHATTLRNGGTDGKGSSKRAQNIRVRGLPETADGDVALPWPERDGDDEERVECRHEPVLVVKRKQGREC